MSEIDFEPVEETPAQKINFEPVIDFEPEQKTEPIAFTPDPPANVALPLVTEEVGQVRGVANAFQRGVIAAMRNIDVLQAKGDKSDRPTMRQERKAFERAMNDPAYQQKLIEAQGDSMALNSDTQANTAAMSRVEMTRGPKAKLEQAMRDAVTAKEGREFDIAEASRRMESIPKSEAMQRWDAAGNDDWYKVLAKDPVEIIANITLESLPQSAAGIVAGGVAGSRLGPVGTAAGMGAGSLATEYASSLVDGARQAGYDFKKEEDVRKFFADEKAVEKASIFAMKRGVPVAALDALSAGVAGRFLAPAIEAGGVKAVAKASAKELGAQMAAGAYGEASAQTVAGQELSAKDIAAEALGELASGPVEAATNIRSALEKARAQSTKDVTEVKGDLDLVAPSVEQKIDFEPVQVAPEATTETVAQTEEPQTITRMEPRQHPVVEVPLKELSLSEDVPNFKADADPETGVVQGQKLEGKYERLGTGAITVWERSNGKKEVISGRHRFDLARRAGETTIPGQIVREADGFTRAMAMTLDAEMNIRDGQGSTGDYANYFRNSEVTEQQAKERGLLSRQKGKDGWTLGKLAGNDLYALYRGDKISEAQAVAIAKAAPGEDALQRVGSKQALKGLSPVELGNFVQAVRLKTKALPMEQLDLFGADDAAMNEAARMAKAATKFQRDLLKEIRATDNAARNAEMARSKGLEFKRSPEELQRENYELATELRRWDNWALHADLVEQVLAAGKPELTIVPRPERRGSKQYVQALLPELQALVPSNITVHVLQSVNELPTRIQDIPNIRASIEAGDSIGGLHHRENDTSEIYLIADNLPDEQAVKAAFLEELLGHGGMQQVLSAAERAELFDFIQLTKPEAVAEVSQTYRADTTTEQGRELVVNEIVAKASGLINDPKWNSIWQRFLDVLQTVLSRLRMLPRAGDGAAFDARMRGIIRRGLARLTSELEADAQASPERKVRKDGPSSYQSITTPPGRVQADLNIREPGQGRRRFPQQVDASSDISNEVRRRVTNRTYERRTNETDAAFAKRIVDEAGGPVTAMGMYESLAENQPGAIRGMLASQIIKGLAGLEQQAAMTGNQAESNRMADLQGEFINRFSEETTDAGQFIQSLAAFASMTPQGQLSRYRRLVDGAEQKRLESWKPVVEGVQSVLEQANRETLGDLNNSKQAQDAAQAAVDAGVKNSEAVQQIITLLAGDEVMQLPEVQAQLREALRKLLFPQVKAAKASGLWAQYKKGAVGSLVNAVEKSLEGRPKGGKTMLGEFAGTLTAVLREQLTAKLDLQDQQGRSLPPATYFQKLMSGLNNPEKYAEVWAATVEKLQAQYPENPDVQNLNPRAPQLFGEEIIQGVIEEELKAFDTSLREMVAGHYRAANDGRTLRDKIVERTGLEGEQALQLSRMIDRVFSRQTAKIRNDIDNRVKSIRGDSRLMKLVRSGLVDIDQLPTDDTNKELARVMRQQMVDLNQVIRKHFTVVDETGKSLTEKLVAEAGLPAEQAEKFAQVLERRFKELATERKRKALAKLGVKTKAQLANRPGLEQKLIELSNLGALDEQKYYDAVAEKLGLPVYQESVAREIVKRANAVQLLPEGSIQQQRGVIDLMNYIARQKGFKWWEMPVAFWYANILSGITTQLVNAVSNFNNLVANVGLQIVRRPADTFEILTALGEGFQKGKLEAKDIITTGQITGTRLLKMEAARPLELKKFTGWKRFLNAWKYVGRTMSAADMLFYKPAEEMKAYAAAKLAAQQEGLSGEALKQRVREVLQRLPEQRLAAETQATAEGLDGRDHARRVEQILELGRPDTLRESARDYALRVTFNNKPYGVLGALAEGVNWTSAKVPALRMVVPFTNIVSNVTNEGLNYFPPIGLGRALYGHWKGELQGKPITDPDAMYEQYAKAAAGTMAMTAAALLFAPDPDDDDPQLAMYGAGPGTGSQRSQMKAAGWQPYTIKVGNRYYSYAQTPLALPFAVMGNYFDAIRYKHLDEQDALNRAAYALSVSGKVITEQSFLSGVADLFTGLGRTSPKGSGEALTGWAARTGSSVVIPNAIRQVDRLFDPTIYDAPTIEAALVNQVPFVRSVNRPALNALGEPMTSGVFNRFTSGEVADPVWQTIARKKAWVSMPSQGELNDEQYYQLLKLRGERLRRRLETLLPTLDRMNSEDAKELVSEISEQETRAAKKQVRSR